MIEKRKDKKICKTKYPILMVHGIFFRDFPNFNYWGRIPGELIKNGAEIYYGNHESANSVVDAAEQIKNRINEILKETGAEKVNIIAHSKGGLDSRYAISKLGMDDYIASLTTINTPHRGCEFAEYLLNKVPEKKQNMIAKAYNKVLKKHDATCHGEMEAIRDASSNLGTHTLSGCELYTTAAPCPMCKGAILWANIDKVYYGCTISDTDSIGFRDEVFYANWDNEEMYMSECDREDCLKLFEDYANGENQRY